jgi:hypothetical protein
MIEELGSEEYAGIEAGACGVAYAAATSNPQKGSSITALSRAHRSTLPSSFPVRSLFSC